MKKPVIRLRGLQISVAVLLMVLTGCASNYKDFKISDVDDDEGVAIGKVTVIYNGYLLVDSCKICINSSCQELTDEGYVFLTLNQGSANIESLFCRDIQSGHLQNYSFQDVHFEVKPGVNYFGDVTFNWINEDPATRATMGLVILGPIGGLMAAGIENQDDGEISISVDNNISPVLNAFRKQVGNKEVQAKKSIVAVETQAEK